MKKSIAGGILTFFGFFMLAGFLLSTRPSNLLADSILLLLFALGPIASGILLIRNGYITNKKSEYQARQKAIAHREKQVLKLAREKGRIPDTS